MSSTSINHSRSTFTSVVDLASCLLSAVTAVLPNVHKQKQLQTPVTCKRTQYLIHLSISWEATSLSQRIIFDWNPWIISKFHFDWSLLPRSHHHLDTNRATRIHRNIGLANFGIYLPRNNGWRKYIALIWCEWTVGEFVVCMQRIRLWRLTCGHVWCNPSDSYNWFAKNPLSASQRISGRRPCHIFNRAAKQSAAVCHQTATIPSPVIKKSFRTSHSAPRSSESFKCLRLILANDFVLSAARRKLSIFTHTSSQEFKTWTTKKTKPAQIIV